MCTDVITRMCDVRVHSHCCMCVPVFLSRSRCVSLDHPAPPPPSLFLSFCLSISPSLPPSRPPSLPLSLPHLPSSLPLSRSYRSGSLRRVQATTRRIDNLQSLFRPFPSPPLPPHSLTHSLSLPTSLYLAPNPTLPRIRHGICAALFAICNTQVMTFAPCSVVGE